MSSPSLNHAYVQILPPGDRNYHALPVDAESTLSGNDEVSHRQQWYFQWGLTKDDLFFHTSQDHALQKGTEAALFEWLANNQCQSITLILPGERVVTRSVSYHEKEKRHFAKLLPYAVEDDVIDEVDSLHFSIGLKQQTTATIAYINNDWFLSLWELFQQHSISITHCVADFQCIIPTNKKLTFWFSGQRLFVHSEAGAGFSCARELASTLLHSFFLEYENMSEEDNANDFFVYMECDLESDQGLAIVNLFDDVAPELNREFLKAYPGFSDALPQTIDFCVGPYAKKTSRSQWIKEYRGVGILAVIACVLFLGMNFFTLYTLQHKNQTLKNEIELVTRQVIPRGVINDPVRQLRQKLGQAASSNDQPSQVVYWLSIVAPIVKSLGVEVSAINYSHKEQELRVNIQADSFNMVEKLRVEINQQGLNAELLSSNAKDNQYQARLRIKASN